MRISQSGAPPSSGAPEWKRRTWNAATKRAPVRASRRLEALALMPCRARRAGYRRSLQWPPSRMSGLHSRAGFGVGNGAQVVIGHVLVDGPRHHLKDVVAVLPTGAKNALKVLVG